MKTLEELKKELEQAEEDDFMNQMIDRWSSDNYSFDTNIKKKIAELQKQIKELETAKESA